MWFLPSFFPVVLIGVSEFLFKGREGFLGGRTSCRPVGKGQVRAQDQLLRCPPPRAPRVLQALGWWWFGLHSAPAETPPGPSPALTRAQMADLVCCAFNPDPCQLLTPCLILGRQGGCSSRFSLSWALPAQPALLASFLKYSAFPEVEKESAFSLLSSGGFRRKK